jgi:DNA-binding transcriptional MerR regulator
MVRPGYPIRAVAKMTGISLDTLRAWERRYEAVRPERGERGRVYRDRDVRRLMLLKELVGSGHAIGQIASLPDARLEQLLRGAGLPPEAGAPGEAGPIPAPLKPLFAAIEEFDAQSLDREFGKLALAHPPGTLVHEVVHPLLRRLGDGWEEGKFSVAQEHLVSAALRNLLGGMMRLYSSPRASAAVLLTTPSGELHEFGILCAALLAAGGGLRPVYLGPNLPPKEIVVAARKASATAVILGVCIESTTLDDQVKTIARGLPGTELWVGGREGVIADGWKVPHWRWISGFHDLEKQLARIGARF